MLAWSQLHFVMRGLQQDLGIEDLSCAELDVLSVSIQLSKSSKAFASADIVGHPLLEKSSRATLYRAISSLENRGLFLPENLGTRHSFTLKEM